MIKMLAAEVCSVNVLHLVMAFILINIVSRRMSHVQLAHTRIVI